MRSRIKYRLDILSKLLPYSRGVKRFFILNIIMGAAAMLLAFANPLFYKLFIDDVILGGEFSKMLVVAGGYLGVFAAAALLGYAKNYAGYTLVNTVLYRVKSKIWNGLFSRPFAEYESMSIGDMKMRLEDDTGQISTLMSSQTVDYLIAYLTLIISAGILLAIDWRLAIFTITAIPLTFLLDSLVSKKEKELNAGNRVNHEKMSSWMHSSVQGWREVKALNLANAQKRQYVRFLHNFALYFAKWENCWTARVQVLPKLKDEFFMRFGLYFIGGFLIIAGQLRISDLLVFAAYYEMLAAAVKTVSTADAELQANMSLTDRLKQELDKKEAAPADGGIIPDSSNTICLMDVSFAYENAPDDVIRNFNLTISRGERVAITGKSGCGKTTLLKLITGMVSPTDGSVFFSGVDLTEIDLSSLHKRIGFVMQENMLFNDTIRENLFYGRDGSADTDLREACRRAYILDFIDSLPDGFDTVIGERGVKLSGGQRQRLVLARLFLRDVDVFIFDEATSALDQYSESIVHDAIRSIAGDKTVIVVSHRESSISLCERVVELQG